MNSTTRCLLPVLLAAASAVLPARAAQTPGAESAGRQPLWEIGIGGAVGGVADYPASDRYRVRALPFPYFVYRGRLLRSDENGARLRQQIDPDLEFDFSGGASFPVHSDSSGPRAGMPDLDYLFELGPRLRLTLDRPAPGLALLAEVPLRTAFSTDWRHLDYRGLVFAPDLALRMHDIGGSRWQGYADLGLSVTTARFQQYFFAVAPQYATAARPAYDAHGGYLGTRLELGVGRRIGDGLRVFFYGRVDDFAGNPNAGSPLFKSHLGLTAFTGFAWSFLHAQQEVEEPPGSS